MKFNQYYFFVTSYQTKLPNYYQKITIIWYFILAIYVQHDRFLGFCFICYQFYFIQSWSLSLSLLCPSLFLLFQKCTAILLGTYFNAIMFMVASSVVTTILILNYHHRVADTHQMPDWVRSVSLYQLLTSPHYTWVAARTVVQTKLPWNRDTPFKHSFKNPRNILKKSL